MINELSKRFLEALEYLIKEKFITDNKSFASQISVSTSMITEISKGRSNVGLTAIQNTVLKFPISADWLLTGEGSMLRSGVKSSPCPPASTPSDAIIMRLMDKLDDKEAENKQLQAELCAKSEELAVLKAQQPESTTKSPKGLPHAKPVSTEKHTSPTADNATSANAL